jgi:selenocysteine-specific elongation factor
MGHVIVGTAGHIDHGKSSLVRALTGTDPDRLPEEKRRQITIDLGFAFLEDVAAIIDVPGHEKFIHNMVAGASTVDFALFVVAADDGVMPQTREHLHILRLLGIKHGAIVLTKCGVTEADWRVLVKEQIRSATQNTFLYNAQIFEVDSLSRQGIPDLRSFLLTELPKLPRRHTSDVLRIPIDRVFTIHGHGTVVTGTVLSGTVQRDQKVELNPGAKPARVKQLQTNAREQTQIASGMRAALNLNTEVEPERGQTITQPGALLSSRRLAVAFEQILEAPQVKDRQRVRILIGTQEVMGRFRLIGENGTHKFALLLLDAPVVAAFADRFILRRYSPLETLGGGVILDIDPSLRGGKFREQTTSLLTELSNTELPKALPAWLHKRAQFGIPLPRLLALFALSESSFKPLFLKPESHCKLHGSLVYHSASFQMWKETVIARLKHLHKTQPAESGFSAAQVNAALPLLPVQLLDFTLAELLKSKELSQDGALFRHATAVKKVDDKLLALIDRVIEQLKRDAFAPSSSSVLSESLGRPKSEIEQALVAAYRAGRAYRLGTDIFFEKSAFESAVKCVRDYLSKSGSFQVSDLSKQLNSSRKYVVPFLEFLDTKGITERRGNERIPGRNFDKNDIL